MEFIESLEDVEALFIGEGMELIPSSGWKGKAGR